MTSIALANYPFAHEIIVVEAASPAAEFTATSDGHSTDGTLETLRRFATLIGVSETELLPLL